MSEKLRIELTRAERKKSMGTVIAFEFSVRQGEVVIRECWASSDEVYSDGLTIGIPARVWAEALPWIAERTLPAPLMTGRTTDE